MRHSMSHFALGSVGFCRARSTHCSELSTSAESLLRHKLRCSFPSLTVFTVINLRDVNGPKKVHAMNRTVVMVSSQVRMKRTRPLYGSPKSRETDLAHRGAFIQFVARW